LFDKLTAEAKAGSLWGVAHCVSADLSMHAGIADIFRRRYGGKEKMSNQRVQPGGCAWTENYADYRPSAGAVVYALVTKKEYHSKPSYDSLERSLRACRELMIEHRLSQLLFPRLGCGLDRLDWDGPPGSGVRNLITKVFGERGPRCGIWMLCEATPPPPDPVPTFPRGVTSRWRPRHARGPAPRVQHIPPPRLSSPVVMNSSPPAQPPVPLRADDPSFGIGDLGLRVSVPFTMVPTIRPLASPRACTAADFPLPAQGASPEVLLMAPGDGTPARSEQVEITDLQALPPDAAPPSPPSPPPRVPCLRRPPHTHMVDPTSLVSPLSTASLQTNPPDPPSPPAAAPPLPPPPTVVAPPAVLPSLPDHLSIPPDPASPTCTFGLSSTATTPSSDDDIPLV
jgi:hypothetical protein